MPVINFKVYDLSSFKKDRSYGKQGNIRMVAILTEKPISQLPLIVRTP